MNFRDFWFPGAGKKKDMYLGLLLTENASTLGNRLCYVRDNVEAL